MPPFSSNTNKAAELLAENVARLMDSETFKEALKFKSRFYRYSFNNCLLIYLQCPTATYVAGYKTWQQLGRQVRKGEKGISILAPIVKKLETGAQGEGVGKGDGVQKRLVGFKSASVFDVQQTDGEPVPELPRPERLTGDSTGIQLTLKALETYATERGFPVRREALQGNALGKFSLTSKAITLRDDLEPLQELKTLVHELAHALMHRDISPQSTKRHLCELEAESCAFLVCHSLGLDTSRYSFAYLANWADEPAELLPAAEKASRTADAIVETLRGLFFLRSQEGSFATFKAREAAFRRLRLKQRSRGPHPKTCVFVAASFTFTQQQAVRSCRSTAMMTDDL